MADRHVPPARMLNAGVSKARSGMTSSSHSQGVRRNLFQSQLTRRPTALSGSEEEELHLDAEVHRESQHRHHSHFQPQPETAFPQDDIVVRNHNGEIELGDPPTLPLDEAEDMEALDARHENEKERQRLCEASSLRPSKASLRAKVAALDEDNWLYEPVQPSQLHQ
ncbi:hypothetical protein NEMBOFW57_005449 [Staphylotrichum longicolle]|uniref:Uncharacterized protein n=1 Tax=Staphylotrichum longicolle TaxID=669026 RepID=A0AAD4EXD5_9PEZI|nr:hypothetical protein NEMBOFW57_005449 [Staphylotrichum longicolle]